MNKQELMRRIHGDLSRSLESTRESIEKTRQQAIEAPGAMESKSDTTKAQMSNVATTLQGSYESSLQTLRDLEALMNNPSQSVRVAGCSLVEVRDASGSKEVYLLLPAGGGNTYEIDGEEVTVISDRAPLAHALIDHVVGDGVIVKIAGNARTLTIVAIS
jgi:transcription elongation GreA/GreB family factor